MNARIVAEHAIADLRLTREHRAVVVDRLARGRRQARLSMKSRRRTRPPITAAAE